MQSKISLFLLSLIICLSIVSCKHSSNKVDKQNIPQELVILNEAIVNDSSNSLNFTNRGEYFQKHDQLNNALADINKALSLNAKDTKAHMVLSDIKLMMGKPQESLDALKQVLDYENSNTDVHIAMAKLYLVMKDYENCAKSVEIALKINSKLPDAYYLKGMALMENDKMDEAIRSFQNAVGIDQKQYDALMQLGYIYASRESKLAIEYFKSATLARSDATEAFYNLGLLYQENEQPDKAIEAYNSIVKIDSVNKLAIYNIGYVNLVYKSDYKKAEEFFSKALEIDSTYADAWFNRGYSRELQGKNVDARKDFKQVMIIRNNDPKSIEALNRIDKLERK